MYVVPASIPSPRWRTSHTARPGCCMTTPAARHPGRGGSAGILTPPPDLLSVPRFDIVLMKEGRMKGQAFVGLPSERSAERALRDTNGYVLYDKPLVVVSFQPTKRTRGQKEVLERQHTCFTGERWLLYSYGLSPLLCSGERRYGNAMQKGIRSLTSKTATQPA